MYFDIVSIVLWKSLMDSAKYIFKDKDINMTLKRIKTGWDSKLGFVIGPRVEVALMAEYEKEFAKDYGTNREDFEFRKRKEYEKDLNSLCIVIYIVEEKKEEINDIMKRMDNDKENIYEFYSYLTDTVQDRYNVLVLN